MTATAPMIAAPVDLATAYLIGEFGPNYREVLGLGAPGEHPHADHYEPGESPFVQLMAGLTAADIRDIQP